MTNLATVAQVAAAYVAARNAATRDRIRDDLAIRINGSKDKAGNWVVRPNKRKAWRDLAAAIKANDTELVKAFADGKAVARDLRIKRKTAAEKAAKAKAAKNSKPRTSKAAKADNAKAADPAATLAAALGALPKEERAAAFFAALKTLL